MEILQKLKNIGAIITVKNDDLIISGGDDEKLSKLITEIRQHKNQIIKHLTLKQQSFFDQTDPFESMAGFVFRDDYAIIHPSDRNLWMMLFVNAEKQYGPDLPSILMFIRNTGAVIEWSDQLKHYKITPVFSPTGFIDVNHYQREGQQPLMKYKNAVVKLLKELPREGT